MIRLFILIGIFLVVSPAFGEDAAQPISFTTIRGREYRNVTLVRTVGRSIECMTAAGLQRVPIVYLPEEMRGRYAEVLAKHQTPKVGEPISFQTVNGTEFKDVMLAGVEPDGISIATDSGVQKVRLDFLAEGFRELFDFDEAAAAEYADARKIAKAQAALRAHLRQLESQAAAEKALADRAQSSSPTAPSNGTDPSALGTVGAQRLGTPKLGGTGQNQ